MEFLHREIDVGPDDLVEVMLDHPANVQLLDAENFDRYRKHEEYRCYGGHATESPFRIRAPYKGRWHLVVDLGGGVGSVKAAIRTSGALVS